MVPSPLVRTSLCLLTSSATVPPSALEGSALLQRKMKATSGMAASEARLLEGMAESVVMKGAKIDADTKEKLRSLIQDELDKSKEQIKAGHDADVTEGNAIKSNYETTCKATFTASQQSLKDALNTQTGSAGLKKTTHDNCRAALVVDDDDMIGKCNTITNFNSGLRSQAQQLKDSIPPARDGWESWWSGVKGLAAQESDWSSKEGACVDAEDQRATRVAQCNTDQTGFERDVCSHRKAGAAGCTAYDACREQAESDLAAAIQDGSVGQSSRQVEWEAILKLECFAKLLLEEEKPADQAGLTACKNLDVDTSHLVLPGVVLPAEGSCDMSPLDPYGGYPCTTSFRNTCYKDSNGNELMELGECQACDPLAGGGASLLNWASNVCTTAVSQPPGDWRLAMNLNTRDGNVVNYYNNDFWESADPINLGGATDNVGDSLIRDFKDTDVYNSVKVENVLIVVHKDGDPQGWRIWKADGTKTLHEHFSEGNTCLSGYKAQYNRVGTPTADFDVGCLPTHEPLVRGEVSWRGNGGNERDLYFNTAIGNDPNRVQAYLQDYGNRGAGLGTAYDTGAHGHACSVTLRPQSDAQAFSDHTHWKKGLIGTDNRCGNGHDCPKPAKYHQCGQCPWTDSSGFDLDYAIYVN